MLYNAKFREMIDGMFVPPQDYDSIQVQTRETPEEPVLIVTLFRNKQVIFFHNYELESVLLAEVEQPGK